MSTDSVDLNFNLHEAQGQILQDDHRFVVVVAGRRFGKSYLARVRAAISALSPENTKRLPVWIIAPTHAQAKQIYWRPLIDMLAPLIENTNVNEGLLTLKTGVQIGVKGSDRPDTLRGVGLFDVVLDEYATMKPEVWEEIIRPALSDVRGRALFIGTPDGRNHFYDLYVKAKHGGDPDWAAYHFESTENIFLPAGEVEAARASMSSAAFNKEYRASFDSTGTGRIKAPWILYDEKEPEKGEVLVAIDLAGFADMSKKTTSKLRTDFSAIVVARVWEEVRKEGGLDQKWYVKDIKYGRWSIGDTVTKVCDVLCAVRPAAWGMEKGTTYNAVMPLVLQELGRRNELLPLPIPLTHGNVNKNDRILYALEGRFEHGKIIFARGDWNAEAEDQLLQFPSRLVHDDIPDGLSYIEQVARDRVFYDVGAEFEGASDSYWEPVDATVGF